MKVRSSILGDVCITVCIAPFVLAQLFWNGFAFVMGLPKRYLVVNDVRNAVKMPLIFELLREI